VRYEQFRFYDVVFFGRSIDEYVRMFDLDLSILRDKKILDCCAGPSAFASQAAALNIHVTACDPRYADESGDSFEQVVNDHASSIQTKQEALPDLFYPEIVSVSERKRAMQAFIADYRSSKGNGRYVYGSLPSLPFEDRFFDAGLCGNLLFLYSAPEVGGMMKSSPFDYHFHLNSIKELMRVVKEDVRIYPLLAPGTRKHKWLQRIVDELSEAGFVAEVLPVAQRDIIGAEYMLRVQHKS
jgi:hypothetical protein